MDYYNIISISRPMLARDNIGLDFVSGQYGCLFSRCRKYVINSLIHGYFHTRLVIIPRPMDLGMITRPIWKCPCINLYIFFLIFNFFFLIFFCFFYFSFFLGVFLCFFSIFLFFIIDVYISELTEWTWQKYMYIM